MGSCSVASPPATAASLLQRSAVSDAPLAVDTVFAFVAMQGYVNAQSTRAAVESLASLGKFTGHVVVLTDQPDCLLKTLSAGTSSSSMTLLDAGARMQVERSAVGRVSLPGLDVHVIKVPQAEALMEARLQKTYIWEAARLAGLEPKQVIYVDADIVVAKPLDKVLSYLAGDATGQLDYSPEDQMTDEELTLLDLDRRGQPLPVYANGSLGGLDNQATVPIASAAAAKVADILLFGSYYRGFNPRQGGVVVSRQGAGEKCMAAWRDRIKTLQEEATDDVQRFDQVALGDIQCNVGYLPWQWMHFPTKDSLQLSRREHFIHFTRYRLTTVIREIEPVEEWFEGVGFDPRYAAPFGMTLCESDFEHAYDHNHLKD